MRACSSDSSWSVLGVRRSFSARSVVCSLASMTRWAALLLRRNVSSHSFRPSPPRVPAREPRGQPCRVGTWCLLQARAPSVAPEVRGQRRRRCSRQRSSAWWRRRWLLSACASRRRVDAVQRSSPGGEKRRKSVGRRRPNASVLRRSAERRRRGYGRRSSRRRPRASWATSCLARPEVGSSATRMSASASPREGCSTIDRTYYDDCHRACI
mmetsp:Transcript_59899/g.128523  ORF Transcript_59899/g.128523 Transcript_59899/m.128523 type:complete len:211 (+) Transcript_59899:207-839(+)